MAKTTDMMRTMVAAGGVYGGSRAILRASTNGLSPAFVDTTQEISVQVTESRMPLNVFALLDSTLSGHDRGMNQRQLKAARKKALALAKVTEALEPGKLWASKSLVKAPSERAPVEPTRNSEMGQRVVFERPSAVAGSSRSRWPRAPSACWLGT